MVSLLIFNLGEQWLYEYQPRREYSASIHLVFKNIKVLNC